MENINQAIEFVKNITPADLQAIEKHSKEMVVTYEYFKSDTNDFTETEFFEMVEEMGETLIKWVNTVQKMMEKYPEDFQVATAPSFEHDSQPKFSVGEKVVYDGTDQAVIESIHPKREGDTEYMYYIKGKYIQANASEHRLAKPTRKSSTKAVATPESLEEKERKKEVSRLNSLYAKIEEKRQELANLQNIVRSNAEFKEKIATEMQAHLHQVGLSGLGRKDDELTPNELMNRLNEKIKFYKNLIRGDKSDFQAIAKRIGLDFRKSAPRKKKTPEYEEGLQGLGRQKQSLNLWGKFVEWFND